MFNRVISSIKESKRSTKITFIVSLALILIIVLATVVFKPNNIDVDYGDDGSGDYFLYHARLYNTVELEKFLNKEARTYDLLAKDIMAFGRKTIPAYTTNPPKVVGFVIDVKKISKNNTTVTMEGKYGSSKDTIKITFELLKNDRIKNKMTNLKSGFVMEGDLPSNSKDNLFIAKLPIVEKDFNIYYSKEEDFTYRIDVAKYDQINKFSAINYLKDAIGEDFVNDDTVIVYYATSSFDKERTEYIQTSVSDIPAL